MRAGVPSLILWDVADGPIWGAQVKRLKVGTTRRFTSANRKSLAADLRVILASDCIARSKEIAGRMTKPAASVAKAADLLEERAKTKDPQGIGVRR
jgi:UDP:flavonoid glycosyltransferase YjiC (YdhE family)